MGHPFAAATIAEAGFLAPRVGRLRLPTPRCWVPPRTVERRLCRAFLLLRPMTITLIDVRCAIP
eukprot:1937307-Lingulodinium_polyedra.AAC.1